MKSGEGFDTVRSTFQMLSKVPSSLSLITVAKQYLFPGDLECVL